MEVLKVFEELFVVVSLENLKRIHVVFTVLRYTRIVYTYIIYAFFEKGVCK